jgi:hypothetical protein
MIIINTTTVEDFIEVVEWAFSKNIIWYTKTRSINESLWYDHGSSTCLIIRHDFLTYCGIDYASSTNKKETILNMLEFHQEVRSNYAHKFGLK